MNIGYVVIEWNQASHQPNLMQYGDLYDHIDDAAEECARAVSDCAQRGRRERYAVAAVEAMDDPA
jgi:hypothetical protein